MTDDAAWLAVSPARAAYAHPGRDRASALEPATIACGAGRRGLEISAPISQLPLALIPTATVALLLVLHITSTSALVRAPQTPLPATAPLTAAPK